MKNTIQENSFVVGAIKQINEMENLIKESLEILAEKAVSEKLKKACLKHAEQTETHIERLDEALSLVKKHLDEDDEDADEEEEDDEDEDEDDVSDKKRQVKEKIKDKEDDDEESGFFQKGKEMLLKAADFVTPHGKSAFHTLLTESLERIDQYIDTDYSDIAIIQLCRTVEHLEISIYDTLCMFLDKQKGMEEAADLLRENLEDELETDKKLSRLVKAAIPKL